MPQTRFVPQKAFEHGLQADRRHQQDRSARGAGPGWVLDQTFDLFDRLGATEAQLDFPVVYASAPLGFATLEPNARGHRHDGALFEAHRHPLASVAGVDVDGPLQLQVSLLDYSSYVGAIAIGRIKRGHTATAMPR